MSETTHPALEALREVDATFTNLAYAGSLVNDVRAAIPALEALVESENHLKQRVDHWRVKATCYGNMVRGVSPVLEKAGHPVDGSQDDGSVGGVRRAVEALLAERDQLRAALERVEQASAQEHVREIARAALAKGES